MRRSSGERSGRAPGWTRTCVNSRRARRAGGERDSLGREARVSVGGVGRHVQEELLGRVGAPSLLHVAAVVVVPKVSVKFAVARRLGEIEGERGRDKKKTRRGEEGSSWLRRLQFNFSSHVNFTRFPLDHRKFTADRLELVGLEKFKTVCL